LEIPVVILGVNFYTALGAIRTLGRRGVPVYALDHHLPIPYPVASRYVTETVLCPAVTDETALAGFLIEFSERFDEPPVLMATIDSYAIFISRATEKLAPHYRFPANRPGYLEQLIDKQGLARVAEDLGLRTPKTMLAGEGADLQNICREMPYPCIVKPALSYKFVQVFRQKCLLAADESNLLEALEAAKKSGLEVIVQEVIPGFDDRMFVFDFYVDRLGRITHTMSGQKLRQFPIHFGSSTLTRQAYDPELEAIGLDYADRLGYRGFGELEFKKHDHTGLYYMIEINARLSTLNALFDKCGQEFAYILYRFEDMISVISYLRKRELNLLQVIRPWLGHRKAHAVWAADDPLPLLVFLKLVLGKAARKLLRLARRLSSRNGRTANAGNSGSFKGKGQY